MEIKELFSEQETKAAFGTMRQLRTHLSEEEYIGAVGRMRRSDGYRLVAAFDGGEVKCVAGFRVQELLAYGKVLYVDDLVADERARSGSYGRQVMDWLVEEAKRSGCGKLQLDSGVQRYRAHGFYFREGMKISSYHFVKDL